MMALYQITTPKFCGGVEVSFGKVVRTPPCFKYMKGLLWGECLKKINKFGWTVKRVDENPKVI